MRTPVLALLFVLSSLAPTLAQATNNVLLVIADDVGVDGIGCYGLGAAPPPTPNIDALAQRGVRFTNAIACPTCSPTRASILTGRHGFRTGVGLALGATDPGLSPTEVLLPEILAPAGITTALFGKWHLGVDQGPLTPTAEGFGTFTGGLQGAVNNYYLWPKVENGTTALSPIYSTTDIVDEALTFLANTTTPWFVVVSFHAAHSPFHEPPANLHTQNLAGLDPSVTPIPFFKAMIEAMDTEIGRLFAGIAPATMVHTNVVLLGDNGTTGVVVEPPFLPGHGKGTVYEGGVRVPLIVAGPAVGGLPRIEPNLVHAVDLFSTMAAMQGVNARAAVPASVPLDGVDSSPLLAAAAQAPVRRFAYSQEFSGSTAMGAAGDEEMVRNGQFTLLRFRLANGSTREELYDLTSDPWETNDLLLQPLTVAAGEAHDSLWRELAKLRGYAWTNAYGAGCSGGGLSPTLQSLTSPTIGATFMLRVQGLNASVLLTIGALGFQNETWNGVPLPVDLTPAGFTNCSLWLDPVLTAVLTQLVNAAPWPVALPNDPSIVGAALFAQAFPLVPNANPAGVIATGAIEAIVGS